MPYGKSPDDSTDEELLFCFRKNANLKRDPKFAQMYQLDEQNRTAILLTVEKRINEILKTQTTLETQKSSMADTEIQTKADTVSFLEVLKPINGKPEETLQFIKQKTEDADFDFKIFSRIPRLENGKNPYGFNGCIAAMIDFSTSTITSKKYTAWNKSLKLICNIPAIQLENLRLGFMRDNRYEKGKEYPIKAYYLKFRV